MNYDVLEKGVNDVYDYLQQHIDRQSSRGGAAIDVKRDLYNQSTKKIQPFLVELSRIVSEVYQADAQAQGSLKSKRTVYLVMIIVMNVLLSLLVLIGVIIIVRNRTSPEFLQRQLSITLIGMTTLLTVMIVLTVNMSTVNMIRDKTASLIDVRTVPSTQLLWDVSVRHIYYDTIPNAAERDAAKRKDVDIADECTDGEETAVTSSSNAGLIDTQGNACGRRLQLTPEYLQTLKGWIEDFYANKDVTLNKLRYKDVQRNVETLSGIYESYTQLLTKDGSDNEVANADDTVLEAFVQGTVVPLLSAAVTVVPNADVTGTALLKQVSTSSMNACVDAAVKDSTVKLAVYDSNNNDQTCRLYGGNGVVTGRGSGSGQATIVKTQNYFRWVNGTSVLTPVSLKLQPFENLNGCINACDNNPNCTVCYGAVGKSYEAMRTSQSGAQLPLRNGGETCSNDCFVQKTDATNKNLGHVALNLDDRKDYIAKRLAELYALNAVTPLDVTQATLKNVQATMKPDVISVVTAVLHKAERLYTSDASYSRTFRTPSVFRRVLSSRSRTDFLREVVFDGYQLVEVSKTLRQFYYLRAEVETLQNDVYKRFVDALTGSGSIIAALVVAQLAANYYFSADRETSIHVFGLQLLTGVALVVFVFVLLQSRIQKQRKDIEERRKAGYRLVVDISDTAVALNDFLRSNASVIGKLVGYDSVIVNSSTGRLTDAKGGALDLKNAVFNTRLAYDESDEQQRKFLDNLRDYMRNIHDKLSDCQDVLRLYDVNAFPWTEVSTFVICLVVVYMLWNYVRAQLMPSYTMERLSRLLKQRSLGNHTADFSDSLDNEQNTQAVVLVMILAVIVAITVLTGNAARDYKAKVACQKKKR